MKRAVGLFLMLALCISLACPTFAAENSFVPSITYKGEPEIVPVEQAGDETIIGIVREEKAEEQDEFISYIHEPCLVITPVAEAETSERIPDEAAQTLLYVYQELTAGRMKLPYEKAEDYNGEPMVIQELLDGSWLCGGEGYDHDHPEQVAPEKVVFDITFKLGVKPDAKVIVMTYHDEQWEPIVATKNNGDGSVTCTFEHFCPIAISVAQEGATVQTAEPAGMPMLWVAVMLAALAGLVAAFLGYNRNKKK